MSPDSGFTSRPDNIEKRAVDQSTFDWQRFNDALAELRAELAKDNPELPDDLSYHLLIEATNYLQGVTIEDLAQIVETSNQLLRQAGRDLTETDKVQIMSAAFIFLDEEKIAYLGTCLEVGQDSWHTTIRNLIEETYGPDLDYTFGPETLASLNRLAKLAGVATITPTDPALVTAIFWRVANNVGQEDAGLVDKVNDFGLDLYEFIKVAEAQGEEKFTHDQAAKNSEIAVRAVLEQVTRQKLDEQAIRAELQKNGMENSWVSFENMATWVRFWFNEAPLGGNDVAYFGERLWQLQTFAPELLTSHDVRRAAWQLYADGYTRDYNTKALAQFGFSLEALARPEEDSWNDEFPLMYD